MRKVVDVAAEAGAWLGASLTWMQSRRREPWTETCRVCTLRLQSG